MRALIVDVSVSPVFRDRQNKHQVNKHKKRMASALAPPHVAEVYAALFADPNKGLGARLKQGGWEVRFEDPPSSYIHVSKPEWGDEQMNGIHIEAYVLGKQLVNRK